MDSYLCDPEFGKTTIHSLIDTSSPASPSISDAVRARVEVMESLAMPSPPSDEVMRLGRGAQSRYSMMEFFDSEGWGRNAAYVAYTGESHVEASYHVVRTDPGGWVVDYAELCTPELRKFQEENRPPDRGRIDLRGGGTP